MEFTLHAHDWSLSKPLGDFTNTVVYRRGKSPSDSRKSSLYRREIYIALSTPYIRTSE